MTSVSTDRRQGVNAGAAFKVPVRAATTANITLSGLQTIDGVVLVANDRVLVKDQTDQTENGIYDASTGDWTRSVDADGYYDLRNGSLVEVNSGTVNSRLVYVCTASDTITIGTSSITWAAMNPGTPITTPLSVVLGGSGQDTATEAATAFGLVQLTGAGGTANAQTAGAPSNYAHAANNLVEYTPNVTNTGAVTITITPSGGAAAAARNIFYDGAACAGSELVANVPTLLLDDGTRFHIVGYSRKIRGSQLGFSFNLVNGTIVQTRAGNAETIAVKTLAGADPSAADPVYVVFRDQSDLTGGYVPRSITAALSLTVSSGSTLGARSSVPFRIWYTIFDDAGTLRLAVINCVTTVAGPGAGSDVTAIYKLAGWGNASSTAEGVAGAADSAQTFYTGVGVSSKPYAVVGYATWEAGLATAGTWGTAPSRIQIWGPQQPLAGQEIQLQRFDTGAVTTGTTAVPIDDTIPQITEGDQYLSQAITPSSAANVLEVEATAMLSSNTAGSASMVISLHQDSTANALASMETDTAGQNLPGRYGINKMILAATTSATTLRIRAGAAANTTTFNGSNAGRRYGNVINSFLKIREVMG